MRTQTIALYPERKDVTLTSYILDDSSELLDGRSRPAVLICPGGSYLSCSDREAEPVALRFCAMGYHAFVLRYSTYSHGKNGFFPAGQTMEPDPDCRHPAPMRDIGRAFLEIHAHAAKWRVDAMRIALCGFSAGAHNCAMYAVYWHTPVIREHFGADAALLRPAACILGYMTSDYRLRLEDSGDAFKSALFRASSIAHLGTDTPDAALLDALSPVLHVGPDMPPTFLWATAGDTLVPVENSTRMATALAAAGVPFEIHVFEEGSHGLSLADQSSASSLFEIDADAANWVPLAESWLRKRFALPLRERPAWMDSLPG